jgi:hypothetical protein
MCPALSDCPAGGRRVFSRSRREKSVRDRYEKNFKFLPKIPIKILSTRANSTERGGRKVSGLTPFRPRQRDYRSGKMLQALQNRFFCGAESREQLQLLERIRLSSALRVSVSSESQFGNACRAPALPGWLGAGVTYSSPPFRFLPAYPSAPHVSPLGQSEGKLPIWPPRLKGQVAGCRAGGNAEVMGVSGKRPLKN